MLDARKTAILQKVVSQHIETGQPVGSAHVVRDPDIDVSAATVRSDMATLEREGFLTHPHTSAGRIPTDLGYRFFVDHLESNALDPAREEQVSAFFARASSELETMLRDTSRLLSELTDSAAVVVAPAHEALVVRSTLLTRLSPETALLVAVLSNGVVDKHVIALERTYSDDDVETVNEVLGRDLRGQTFGHLGSAHLSGKASVDEVVLACHAALGAEVLPSGESGEIYVGGTGRMAEKFVAVETVREVLSILEQSFVVISLLSDALSRRNAVSIGTENTLDSLAECSLVVAPYRVDNEVVGTIGVLGPTRMNYPQALAAVAVVSRRLGRQLSAG